MRTGTEPEAPYDPGLLFPDLRIGVYRIVFQTSEETSQSFQGSKWRGVLGAALDSLFCPWKKKSCETCLTRDECPIFGYYLEKSDQSGFADPPRPYMLTPVKGEPGQLIVEMAFFSPAERFIPQTLAAWKEAGRGYVQPGRNLPLQAIFQMQPDGEWRNAFDQRNPTTRLARYAFFLAEYFVRPEKTPEPPWKVQFVTQLRLRKDGRQLNALDIGLAFTTLGSRLSLLNLLSGGQRLSREQWYALKAFLEAPGDYSSRLHWQDETRYSNRQRKAIPIGGLQGTCEIIPPPGQEAVWWKWWIAASLFHLGKNVTMGLGKITLPR